MVITGRGESGGDSEAQDAALIICRSPSRRGTLEGRYFLYMKLYINRLCMGEPARYSQKQVMRTLKYPWMLSVHI